MSVFDVHDSIAAIASPPGPGLRGVIRLSGPQIDTTLQQCFRCPGSLLTQQTPVVWPGSMQVGEPFGDIAGELFYWPGPASYTRQRSAEFHCSGSLPVLNAVMRTLANCRARQAQPGEFTMRAFLAGRIDLIRAEAVLGVIDSQSQREMDVALRQLAGGLSGPIQELQESLLQVLAHIEAGLDFVEDDIEFIAAEDILATIRDALQNLNGILRQIDQRQLDKPLPRIVLLGLPNAGKSSLQNALTESGSAIVSEVAGTTRDYLVASLSIGGQEFQLIDTAGILPPLAAQREAIQQQAESQALQMAELADLILLCVDGSRTLTDWERQRMQAAQQAGTATTILVQTKADLPVAWSRPEMIRVSSVSGGGLDRLKRAISDRIRIQQPAAAGEMVVSTANRCLESLRQARDELRVAESCCQSGQGDEVIAMALRIVLDRLAVVIGKVFTDDILDRVFSRFCIGK